MEALFIRGLDAISREITAGHLKVWEKMLETANGATFFQRPLWCLSWYEAYVDEWEPIVALALSNETPIGLAALARHRVSGDLVFAGAGMADYRDFVIIPGQHDRAVEILVRATLELSGGRFLIGPTDPESLTVAEVLAAGKRTGEWWGIVRKHPCPRIILTQRVTELVQSKKSIKQPRAYYRRLGDLRYQRVRSESEWVRLRDIFFEQHTLRQLYTGRVPSFHDSRKRKLFDMMFCRNPDSVHISALWLDDRCLASHFGYSSNGTVYWGAPAMDIREQKHSPGQLLLADIIVNALKEGCREIDLTLGAEEYKTRFGTVCMELPQVFVYAKRTSYWAARTRQIGIGMLKAALKRLVSEDGWQTLKKVAQGSAWPVQWYGGRTRALERWHRAWVTFAISRDRFVFRNLTAEEIGASCFREDEFGDFARCANLMEVAPVLKAATERASQGQTLQTFLVGGQLASYGWSSKKGDEVCLRAFSSVLGKGSEQLVGVHMGVTTQRAFERNASRVYASCRKRERALHRQLEAMGFVRVAQLPTG